MENGRDLLLQALGGPGVLDHDALGGLAELDLLFSGQVPRGVNEQGRGAKGLGRLKFLDDPPPAEAWEPEVQNDAIEPLPSQHRERFVAGGDRGRPGIGGRHQIGDELPLHGIVLDHEQRMGHLPAAAF